MGWENRKGGKYYYHKTRIGSRVESFYLGKSIQAYKLRAMMEEKRLEDKSIQTLTRLRKTGINLQINIVTEGENR